uniref:F-box domain-containing protein n=1 Tax=Pygocentrus nattereri TaxID=42514 RepID=A0A3B4BZ90_PYGNA
SILSLPPELENILFRLSVPDIVSFGSTCHYFHKLSLSQAVWKNLYFGNLKGPRLRSASGRGKAALHHLRSRQLALTMSFNAPMALGFRRVVPTLGYTVLWDYKGTIFVLFTPRQNVMWRRPLNHTILCNDAKDFAVDPCSLTYRQHIYVLVSREVCGIPSGCMGPPAPRIMCDCVEVFQSDTHKMVFRMTFHFSLNFTQLRLCGRENKRTILLLTDTGKVYAMSINEIQLQNSCSYTAQLTLKNISKILPELPIKQIHTSSNSILYLRGKTLYVVRKVNKTSPLDCLLADGSVFVEVHSIGTYYQLFGTSAGQDTYDAQTVIPLMLPYKVVKCSLGLSHLCLLDDRGRVFMQGCNRYGQLGTGDKIDRGDPTMVALSMAPVDVWCGLNHTLVLLQTESGDKEVQGCGCGSNGRLPGCWPGSPVFVKLSIQVPRTASSLCCSKECIFLLCSHDIAEPPASHYIPPGTEDEKDIERGQEEEKQQIQIHLTQMKSCDSATRRIIMLQSIVKHYLTGLSPIHKDFFDTALSIILGHCTTAKMEPQQPSEA